MANEVKVGDRFYHEGRRHPDKEGWLQANGEIIEIIMSSDDPEDEPEPYEVVIGFSDNDTAVYFVEQLEWTDNLGGYWYIV